MSRITWKEGAVVSVAVKGKLRVLLQMLKSPFVAFFSAFSENDSWDSEVLRHGTLLFCTAITNQFLKGSDPRKEPSVLPAEVINVPKYWIKVLDTKGRTVRIWGGTPMEVELFRYGEKPGASLVEKDIYSHYSYPLPVVQEHIALDDHATIDRYETDGLRTFPLLNERLYLCYKKGRVVDPGKDIMFDRPLDPDYRAYVNMLAGKGAPETWGYPLPEKTRTKCGARKHNRTGK